MGPFYLLGVIVLCVVVVLYIAWVAFFQWYKRKRDREAQVFLKTLNDRSFEMRVQ